MAGASIQITRASRQPAFRGSSSITAEEFTPHKDCEAKKSRENNAAAKELDAGKRRGARNSRCQAAWVRVLSSLASTTRLRPKRLAS
jgi:hypothetical protein